MIRLDIHALCLVATCPSKACCLNGNVKCEESCVRFFRLTVGDGRCVQVKGRLRASVCTDSKELLSEVLYGPDQCLETPTAWQFPTPISTLCPPPLAV